MGENIKMAFGDIAQKVARFNEIGEEMANPDADFDALMDEMGKLQTCPCRWGRPHRFSRPAGSSA